MNQLKTLRVRLAAWAARNAWARYLALLALVVSAWSLHRLVNPTTFHGTPGIVELQMAGTRETADSLLAAADRAAMAAALAWDYLLVACYSVLLPLCLVLFGPPDEVSPLDRYAPALPVLAGLLDAVQNILVRVEIGELAAPPPLVPDWVPAVAASCSLLSWTLVVMSGSRLAWLVLACCMRALGYGPRSCPTSRGRSMPLAVEESG
jgi:hypothetical protein